MYSKSKLIAMCAKQQDIIVHIKKIPQKNIIIL